MKNDPVMELWNDIPMADKLTICEKFNFHDLQLIIWNKEARQYVKDHYSEKPKTIKVRRRIK